MKSILQSVAVASVLVLVASCDSSSGRSVAPPNPKPIQNSASGVAVKGVIDGASVTVTDADGDTLSTTTTAAGAYNAAYDVVQVAAGARLPIKVTVGTGTTVCDYVNPTVAGEDCRSGTGFVAFGETYTLASDFQLVSYVPAQTTTADSVATANVSPATHIAALKADAATGGATVANIIASNAAIAGLIQAITGIDLSGTPLHEISVANLAATGGTATPAQLALAAFASAILADPGATESIGDVINRFAGFVTVNADGTASVSGDNLSTIATAVSQGLATAAAKSGNAAITTAVKTAKDNAVLYKTFGTNPIKVAPAPTGGGGDDKTAIQLTQEFVTTLGTVINGILSTTGAQGAGEGLSVTETFVKELDEIATLSSDEAGKAITRLDDALNAAAKTLTGSDETTVTNTATTEDGLEFVLTQTATGFTVTDAKSVWPLAATGDDAVTVTITGATGSATTAAITIPNITMVTTKGSATVQTFTGELSVTHGTVSGTTEAASLKGSVTGGTAGTSFGIDLTLANYADNGSSRPSGTYTAKFSFASATATNLDLSFSGTISSAAQSFNITSGSSAINGTVTRTVINGVATDVDVLTDGTASLTLTVVNGNVRVGSDDIIGSFTQGSATTASLRKDGLITYTDGSVQSLPAVIF